MARAFALRPDVSAAELRRLAQRSTDAERARRPLALAVISDGGRCAEAARFGPLTPQIARDWVVRIRSEGLADLIDGKAASPTPRLLPSR